jgi:predicted CoA-binding protein
MDAPVTAAQEFLAQKRLALVGVSRDSKSFSRGLFRELKRRGYDVVPVNPLGGHFDGEPCASRVQEIAPPADGVIVLTPPGKTDQVVRDCAEAGVRRVWMHRGAGAGSVSPDAVTFCREHGIAVIDGACPFMFLPRAALVHRLHDWIRRRFRPPSVDRG